MKITYQRPDGENGRGAFLRNGEVLAYLSAPLIEEDGRETVLSPDGTLAVEETVEDRGEGLFYICRTFVNRGETARTFKGILEIVTAFLPERYLIPCVSYNGNHWGEGKEPKGMLADNGEPWIFSYDRTSVPSCSVTENERTAVSLFASGESAETLVSGVSVRPAPDGEISQRIYWPVTEAPYTYYETDRYNDRLDTYVTLLPGQRFRTAAYLLLSEPKWKNYGVTETLDRALSLFPFRHGANRTPDELWRLGIAYSRALLREYRGKWLFSSGCWPMKDGGLYVSPHSEIGWCGQNIMNARMLVLEGLRTGDRSLIDRACDVCDAWVEKQSPSGLVLAHYEWYTEGQNWNYKPRDYTKSWGSNVDYKNGWLPETCNTGWAACEMLRIWELLKENGIDRPAYLAFARRILDFFCDHYSETFAFGKAWHFDGRCEESGGTIGAFVTMALCEGYRVLRDERYLSYAERSLAFYMERDLDVFVSTAGAIDCTSVDKETAGPVIISALDLYELTGNGIYLRYAEKAAYYFASWMFVYDAVYGKEAEFTEYGYYTAGSTFVSVQHHALDQWGELMCYEFLRLAKYTGDDRWRRRAVMMWYNATQCIADETNHTFHGMERPVGSQNEAFYEARWGHRKDCNERGHLNDWLVSWVNVFRLYVLDRLDTSDLPDGRHALE